MAAGGKTHCGQCGNEIGESARFCGACGSPVRTLSSEDARPAETDGLMVGNDATAVLAPPEPIVETASAIPATAPAAPGPSASRRRRYLKPLAAIGIFLVAAGAAGAVVLIATRGGDGPSHSAFVKDANALLEPLVAANAVLAARLSVTDSPQDLAGVDDVATALVEQVTRAQGAAGVLKPASSDSQGVQALDAALAANLSYARRVGAVASSPTAVRATAAITAAQAVRSAWQSLASAEPELRVPPTSALLGASQLAALAQAQARAEAATKAAQARAQAAKAGAARRKRQQTSAVLVQDRQWVQAIDSLLRNSAETRVDLGKLITDVQSNAIDPGAATGRIDTIITQRQDLQNQISGHPAPAHFQAAAELLRQSIRYSLDDDIAIQGWINAWYASDAYTYERFFAEHESATSRASAAKAEFLQRYNALRSRLLRLPALNVAY